MASRALPLPFPLRIGTDICQVSRIYRILRSPRGPRFVRRVLTEEEISRPDQDFVSILLRAAESQETIQGKKPAVPPSELRKAAVFMAGRFAAKEAAIKAHHHRRLTFHEIVVRRATAAGAFQQQLEQQPHDEDGDDRPTRLGSGPPIAIIKAEGGVGDDREAALSISHDGDYATAVCMAFVPTEADA